MNKSTTILIFLLISLLVATNCYAKTRYVNTASSGGDGTTNATSGAHAAYASLSAWEDAEDGITLTEPMIVYCEGTSADETAVTIAGWTGVSADNYIKITTTQANRHNGTWDSNKYYLTATTYVLQIQEAYTEVDGLQFLAGASTWDSGIYGTASNLKISNCIIRSDNGSNNADGINLTGADDSYVWNCTATGLTGDGVKGFNGSSNTGKVYFYNCNSVGNARGFATAYDDSIVINCVSANNTDDFNGTFNELDYIASDDDHSGDVTTSWVNISPGATEADDWANAFVDYSNGDFHIKPNSVLKNAGTDLSSEGFSDDIDGDSRSASGAGASWDIGADELMTIGVTIKGAVTIGAY